ncbi:MAG: DUF4262 domain-containing protein [Pseudomonadota bacterium]
MAALILRMVARQNHEQNILAQIEEHGFFSMGVFHSEGDGPNFRYSVGLTKTLDAPEIIIFGLPLDMMHNMLWEMFRQIQDGARLEHGKHWSGLLEGFDCISMAADHPDLFTEYATSANWFWKTQGHDGHPPVYQIVWPGARNGFFPWEDGCAENVITAQPKLWSKPIG